MQRVAFKNVNITFRSCGDTGFYCEWTIDNFIALEYDVSIRSKDFNVIPKHPFFFELQRTSWSKIDLNLCNRNPTDNEMRCNISVSRGKVEQLYNNSINLMDFSKSNQKLDLLENCKLPALSNESLNIVCSIKIATVTPTIRPIQNIPVSHDVQFEYLKELSADLSKIFDQSSHTDFTLNVEGSDIKVHKTILRARSPVFDKMLHHISEDSIDITDVRLTVMKRFVAYLYAGTYKRAINFDEASELYYVADKYEVLTLRDLCKKDLLNLMQVCNACSLLRLANQHSDDVLKDEVIQFIQINFTSVVETESWEDLVSNDTKLAATVMRFCARALS